MNTILLVEDEKPIRSMLEFALSKEGYNTVEAGTIKQAQDALLADRPDLILMDWMLPDASGVQLVEDLKKTPDTKEIPIIMLTANSGEEHKVRGLNAGADDYITKPFSPRELIARIHAVLRRSRLEANEAEILKVKNLKIDKACHRASVEGTDIELGPTEFRLLVFLIEHPERVYSRDSLLNQVWGRSSYVEERTVDVHILRLRRALSPWKYDKCIQTVRSIGYRFSEKK